MTKNEEIALVDHRGRQMVLYGLVWSWTPSPAVSQRLVRPRLLGSLARRFREGRQGLIRHRNEYALRYLPEQAAGTFAEAMTRAKERQAGLN